ncbi:Metalloprotease [Desarmillaria tabescens]|uniref:Neutral protease 2 n=1 Tax=Armillaria tabescens TaxID=1929756 RepID=A0AA39JJA1_ARMTA|nr:Metalloprotease [Desarmillaria tabescens]KAK0441463.1 Metalloprotease [Desarmillaria tabescens]
MTSYDAPQMIFKWEECNLNRQSSILSTSYHAHFFHCLALALSAFASPYKRDAGLTVSLSGPASDVTSIDDLKFTATVANTGSESVKILKYGTILDDMLPTQSFTVTKDGDTVNFTGIKISVSLKGTNDSVFAVIPPGQSVTAEHNLSALFDFASAGPGTFMFTPVTSFYITSPEARVTDAASLDKVSMSSSSVDVNISGDLTKRDLFPVLNTRAVDICTDNTKANVIDASYIGGKSIASSASSYIASNGEDALYTSYFSTTPTDTVRTVFDRVANEASNTRTMDCTDPLLVCLEVPGVTAYTTIPESDIYFCDLFFTLDSTPGLCYGTVDDTPTTAGVMLHELTHATSQTIDVAYGCADDQELLPAEQAVNADNYNCFANEVYKATMCS